MTEEPDDHDETTRDSGDDAERDPGIEITPGSREGSRSRGVWALFAELLKRLLSLMLDDEISKARRKYRRLETKVDAAERKLRLLGVLAFTVLLFLLAASVVWTLAGVVYIVDSTPLPGDPFYLAVGVVVGYLASLVAGLVYSR